MIFVASLLLGMATSSTDAVTGPCAQEACDVKAVLPNIVAWNDRIILVRGWIKGCHKTFECQLAPDRGADYRDTATLEYVPSLESRLGALDGAKVVLRVRVTDECSGENICVDRGPDLIPIGIERVLARPHAKQKAN